MSVFAEDDGARTAGLVDPVRLAEWMDEQGLPGKGAPVETAFISGGASNDLVALNATTGQALWHAALKGSF